MLTVVAALVGIGVLVITLIVKRGEIITKAQKDRAEANEGLVNARDREIADCEKRCDKCHEELEDVTAEFRALTAIDIDKLMKYWQTMDLHLAEMDNIKAENRKLRIRLGEPL